jgi:uncharacterized protein YjbI with pentapeptide repeats
MAATQHTSGNASLKKLRKKLSPSIKKSWFQIGLTLSITVLALSGIAWWENKQKTEPANYEEKESIDKKCEYKFEIICIVSDSKLLGQLQNFAVISAAILFFWDTFDRKKQLERQAWQLIDGAQGAETSGARRQAIEDLHQEGADITGLDADGADLRGINLSGANLERASFKNAILEGANFEGAVLTQANFTGSNLRGANFKKATLLGTIFTESDLRFLQPQEKNGNGERPHIKTDFRDANLGLAWFHRAQLAEAIFGIDESETSNKSRFFIQKTIITLNLIDYYKINNRSRQPLGSKTKLIGAIFWDADLNKTNLRGVDISTARFGGVKNVELEMIRQADKYEEAFYGKEFCEKNKLIEDEKYYKNKQYQRSNIQRMLEITQYITNNKSVSSLDEDGLSDILESLELLKDFIKDSKNPCFLDNDLFDQVLKVEDAGKKYEKSYQELSEQSKINQKLLNDDEDMYHGLQRLEDPEEED